MSYGTICLTCRRYTQTLDEHYRCNCEKPVSSDDGVTPNKSELPVTLRKRRERGSGTP